MDIPLPTQVFPNHVFFDPRPKFVAWLYDYARRRKKLIVDVGAGTGRLGARLMEKGMQILSLDFIEREEPESSVIIADATTWKYKPFHLVVMCRPCRGDWIGDTIGAACDAGAEVIYVGRKEHVKEDTLYSGITRKFLRCEAGTEHEVAYSLREEEK